MKSFIVFVLSYTLLITHSFAQLDPNAFTVKGFKSEKSNYEKRLKRAKSLDEFLKISKEAFKKNDERIQHALSRISDSKLDLVWEKINAEGALTSAFDIKGESSRDKIIFVTSMKFFSLLEKKTRSEVKASGGFEKFKQHFVSSSKFNCVDDAVACQKANSERGVASKVDEMSKADIVAMFAIHILVCIFIIPLCILLIALREIEDARN